MTEQEKKLMKNFKVELLEERLEMWGGNNSGKESALGTGKIRGN